MRAGRLRHRVVIQTNTPTQDGAGTPVPGWANTATRWGRISPLTGNENIIADKEQGAVTHEIEVRYYSGLTSKHRFTNDSRTFEIVSVINPDDRNIRQRCLCREVTG